MVTFERNIRINQTQLSTIEREAEKNHRTASEQLCAILEQAGYSPFESKGKKREVPA
jgi:hypothetical protein